jgi:acetyl-CoA acetyltransferase
MEALGLCPIGEAHRLVEEGGIDSRKPDAIPALSGGGALGNGRMHGVPQTLECYLQLAGRAGERQIDGMDVALACQSTPNFGGVVAYSTAPPE